MTISNYFVFVETSVAALLMLTLGVKLVLFRQAENGWNYLKFFYFSEVDRKLTNRRSLKASKRIQNKLSLAVAVMLILFALLYSFHKVIVTV